MGYAGGDTPLEILQHNARVKTATALLSNGGLAMFGAFAAVLYNGAGKDDTLAMAFIGLVLISVGMLSSKFLREGV